MSERSAGSVRADARSPAAAAALVGAIVASALVAVSVERVVRRMQFPYDLVLWADDYLMTSLMKLSAGLPLYGPIADANSTVYAPGGAWLHHALLAPFGYATSLLANKLLVQVWLAAGVALTTRAVLVLADRTGAVPAGHPRRGLFAWLAAAVLATCAFTNPTADSLHPTTLESVVLGAALWALAAWDGLPVSRRLAVAVALPAAALVVKQNTGAAVAVGLALAAVLDGARRWRGALVTAPLASFAATFGLLVLVTGGGFRVWAVEVLAAHPFDLHKVTDLYRGYGLLFLPVLVVVVVRAVTALRRRTPGDRAWLRAAGLGALVGGAALAALFKRLGGPNNLAVVGSLLTALALPPVVGALAGAAPRLRWGALALLLVQLAVWYPRRRVPDAQDFANAETVCSWAAARMRCGDAVLLGRGSVCYARGGVAVPLDRAMSLIEVTAASRGDELGFHRRLADLHYDVIVMPAEDLHWFGQPLWQSFQGRYRAFHMTQGESEGDFWYHGWQGFSSRPIVFFERVRDAGTHSVDERGRECSPR